MANKITAQRRKPKESYCNCCLKRRPGCNSIIEFHFRNYGSNLQITLCDACLKDAYELGMKAAQSKGELIELEWEEELEDGEDR